MRPIVNFGSKIGLIQNGSKHESVELFLPEEALVKFIAKLFEIKYLVFSLLWCTSGNRHLALLIAICPYGKKPFPIQLIFLSITLKMFRRDCE
jgi:hypothetical protein